MVKYQSSNKAFDKMTITDFTDRLAWDLIYNNDRKEAPSVFISSLRIQPSEDHVEVSCVKVTSQTTSISSVTGISSAGRSELMKHKLKKSEKKEPKSNRTSRVRCVTCGKKCFMYCEHPLCSHSSKSNGKLFYCNNVCFQSHIEEMKAYHL